MQLQLATSVLTPHRSTRPYLVLQILRRAERRLEAIARHRWLGCLAVVLIALGMRAVLLPVFPIPSPAVHDEFSYILGGETFAMGRMANPTHPMWRFFETMHVNMQPTYVSKYPPAQAAFLALGIRLFGDPWYGVWLSMGLLCGALCWMLQGWLPAKYGIIGGILAAMQLAVTGPWINGYWGGAVAALGGALAIGALPRLARKPGASASVAVAAAVLLLANSRPFEGAILMALLSITSLWWRRRCGNLPTLLRAAVVVPVIAGVGITTAFIAYYNWKITGDPWLMPHVLNSREYHWSPNIWLLPAASPPQKFRDPAMKEFWSWDHDIHIQVRHNPLRVLSTMKEAIFSTFVDGPALPLAIFSAVGLLLIPVLRVRIVAALLTAFLCSLLVERYILAHYMAPALGLFLLAVMFGLRLFRTMKVRNFPIGLPLVATILAFSIALFLNQTVKKVLHTRNAPMDAMRFRALVLQELKAKPGRHLVMVRYGEKHNIHEEQVYNGPDIDAQKVVWALDRGTAEDRSLFAYYPDRMVWLFEPDGPAPSIKHWQ